MQPSFPTSSSPSSPGWALKTFIFTEVRAAMATFPWVAALTLGSSTLSLIGSRDLPLVSLGARPMRTLAAAVTSSISIGSLPTQHQLVRQQSDRDARHRRRQRHCLQLHGRCVWRDLSAAARG